MRCTLCVVARARFEVTANLGHGLRLSVDELPQQSFVCGALAQDTS